MSNSLISLQEMIEKYRLDKAGYSFNNTPESSNVDDFEAAYQNNGTS